MAERKYRIWMWVVGALAITLALVMALVPHGPRGGPGRRVLEVVAGERAADGRAGHAEDPAGAAVTPTGRAGVAPVGAAAAAAAAASPAATDQVAEARRSQQPRLSASARSRDPRPFKGSLSGAAAAKVTAIAGAGTLAPAARAEGSAATPAGDELDAPPAPTRAAARPDAPRIDLIPDDRRPAIGVVGEPE
ncbi:MAG: hypothetical protein IPL40_10145 [Proteobacteria bacterium]|nr:hypothetical protein [Pseudomonadota bacterium]